MEEKKLTDEEIVKALEHCGSNHKDNSCEICPFRHVANCYDTVLHDNALDLIHRLQSEIKEYETLFDISNERKYRKMFNEEWKKEYQKDLDKQVEGIIAGFPDFDLVYKLYFEQKAKIKRLTEEKKTAWRKFKEKVDECIELSMLLDKRASERAELQKQVDELKEKIMNLKSAMISRVAIKSYDTMLTTPDDVEEIFGDAYESEFNKFLGQAVKDTAKELLQKIMNIIKKSNGFLAEEVIRIMAKQKGVEVE